MKIVLIPVFKVLLVLIVLIINLTTYIVVTFFASLWNFKLLKYSEFFNNHGDMFVLSGITPKRQDNNLKDTIVRIWNLDFYDY